MQKKQAILEAIDLKNGWAWDRWDWYLNGNYGYDGYQWLQNEIDRLPVTEKRRKQALRRIVINGFVMMLINEFAFDFDGGVSYGYIQKTIANTIPTEKLEQINDDLINKLLENYIEEA